MVFNNIFNNKVIFDDIESERAPFVAPDTKGGDRLVVAIRIEALHEDVIGDIYRLWKAVDTFSYLEVYPPFTRKVVDIIFENKFIQDIRQTNTRVFSAIKGGSQVEVRDVE